jgi:serine/threonine-protein kinase
MRLCPKCGKKTEEARCPDDGTATLVLAQNPDARLTEGTEVNGRYRIDKMIGQGGFGAVYKAKNLATDQDMAIKLLAVSLDSDDSDVIQRFFAEAQVTAALKHPNTIRVFDFGQTEGGALYIAMELLSGRPLNEELKLRNAAGEVLTEDEIITIGVQSLRSLAEAHAANLVHRDLKPHNIFLHEVEGDDPVVKVLDFGIAKRLGSNLTGTGKAFGTPTYMSPEQAQNKNVDRRSDIYSLGCVLYQCAAGQPPFDGDNPLAVLMAHVTQPPPDLRQVTRTPLSEGFIRTVHKALAKNPDERFATAMEMRQALEACRGTNTENLRATGFHGMAQAGIIDSDQAATAAYDTAGLAGRTAAYGNNGMAGGASPLRGATPIAGMAPQIPPPPPGRAGQTGPVGQYQTGATGALDLDGPAKPKSKVPMIVGAVLVLGGGGAFAFFAGQQQATPPPAAVAAAPVAAAPAPVEPAPAAEPPKATEAPAIPDKTEVRLESTPPGAMITVEGKELGPSPQTLTLVKEEQKTAQFHLEGHVDSEVQVDWKAAPVRAVTLRKLDVPARPEPVAEKRPSGGGGRKPSGGSSGGSKPTGGGDKKPASALEERL